MSVPWFVVPIAIVGSLVGWYIGWHLAPIIDRLEKKRRKHERDKHQV